MYIEPTLTTDNRAAYYAYATFPDMNVVTNFIKAHNDVIHQQVEWLSCLRNIKYEMLNYAALIESCWI
jgi:hypothetical protein